MSRDGKRYQTQQREAAGSGQISHEQRRLLTQWTPFAIAILGLWLITSPFTFGYDQQGMIWNDVFNGALLVVLGLLSISPSRSWPRWAVAAIGLWMLMAPLVYWAENPAAYVNGTIIGVLVICFAIVIPPIRGMRDVSGPDVPPGWSFNPSSWVQRAPIITLAIISFLASRYMTAYHLGYIDHAWDPFFGDGTVQVLDSDISEAFPVSDAGLGAIVYLLEAIAGFLGGRDRWRSMPWAVLLFGVLVIPLGIVSITLIILQPLAVGYWCTLCLFTALLMVIMIPLAIPEVVAMGQYAAWLRRTEKPFLENFLRGGYMDGATQASDPVSFTSPVRVITRDMVRGVSAPANLVLAVVTGTWIMASPAVLGGEVWAANSNYLVGPLIILVSMIALSEATRPARFINVLFGAWMVISPWVLSGETTGLIVSNFIAGALLVVLSLPRGPVYEEYAEWNEKINLPA